MAGRIPQQFIDDLLGRIDIVQVIEARVPLKKSGREFSACCPFHNEKTPSFTVSPTKQFYHCFGCGAHGNAIGFLMAYDHLAFVEAVEELARLAGLEVPREAQAAAPEAHAGLYEIQAEAARWFQRQLREHPQRERAVAYLRQRGLSGEIARDFGLGYAPPGWENLVTALGTTEAARRLLADSGLAIRRDDGSLYDRFRDRILFPIHDRRGRVIGFGGRVLGDDKPKYLNSPESSVFHKGRELYGLFEARRRSRKLESLLVVEGYMDVVALAQFGIGHAVATLGTAATREHLEQLFRVVPDVIFCFDGDRAGRAAAWRALENALPVMRDGRQARFLFLPEGEDPDSLVRREGRDAFLARAEAATPFSEYFYEHLRQEADTRTSEGQARLVERARPLLARLPEGVFHDLMVQRLAEQVDMDPGRLTRLLQRGSSATGSGASPPPRRPRRPADGSQRPVRKAIHLLLHQPELAVGLEPPPELARIETPGVPLLLELLELMGREPHLRQVGSLMERFRGHPAEAALWKLASHPPETPEGVDLREELRGLLRLMVRKWQDTRWRQLQDKLTREGRLTDAELVEWQELMAKRPDRPGAAPGP